MLIDDVVEQADVFYDQYGKCEERCNHPSGSCNPEYSHISDCGTCPVNNAFSPENINCIGCCLECSNEVHYGKSERNSKFRETYDCQKLIYYYTGRYTWKYCSEIMYAFESINLNSIQSYVILSLGCGQSPDLMAIEQINQADGKNINYIGVDINPLWDSLHKCIQSYCDSFENMKCTYYEQDVIKFLNSHYGSANIIVLSYLLSSFSDDELNSMSNQLIDLIIKKVLYHKSGDSVFIIINDIDRWTIRKHFDIFESKLKKAGYDINCTKRHFGNRKGMDYGDGSVKYPECKNKFQVSREIKYNCAIKCNSAQYIIEVR